MGGKPGSGGASPNRARRRPRPRFPFLQRSALSGRSSPGNKPGRLAYSKKGVPPYTSAA